MERTNFCLQHKNTLLWYNENTIGGYFVLVRFYWFSSVSSGRFFMQFQLHFNCQTLCGTNLEVLCGTCCCYLDGIAVSCCGNGQNNVGLAVVDSCLSCLAVLKLVDNDICIPPRSAHAS